MDGFGELRRRRGMEYCSVRRVGGIGKWLIGSGCGESN